MAGKIPTTFAMSCNRPAVFWSSQPSLLSCSPPFHLCPPLLPFFPFFLQFLSLFTLFTFPFSFFLFFPQFSSTFPSPSRTLRFFPALTKPTRLHETPLSAMCPTRHRILRRTRHVVKEDFAWFSAFLGTFKKRVLRKYKQLFFFILGG